MSPPGRAASWLKRQAVQRRRERVAKVILRLPPKRLPAPGPDNVSVHLLTSRRDWLGALWSVRTFLEYLGESLPVMFHDDGTLTPEIAGQLRASLPGAVVVSCAEAQAVVEWRLRDFPRCRAARPRHVVTYKLFDIPLLAPGPRYLLLDSDLLFFSLPVEIKEWLQGGERVNLWNEDQGDFLNLTTAEARERHGVRLLEKLNSGLGCLWRESVDFKLLEDYFSYDSVWSHPHRVEQTAYALLSGRFGGRLLPRTYLVDTRRDAGLPPGIVMKHYVGIIRDLFFSEGIGQLLARGFVPAGHS